MADADEKLLRDMLLSVYHEVAPNNSERGELLCRKLAAGLYARGARIEIGFPNPPKYQVIHQSVDKDFNLVWTCKEWNRAMGYRSYAVVGTHISKYLAPDTFDFYKESYWPTLMRNGRIEGVEFTLVTYAGQLLPAVAKSEILRDSLGAFVRTFAKIRVQVAGSSLGAMILVAI